MARRNPVRSARADRIVSYAALVLLAGGCFDSQDGDIAQPDFSIVAASVTGSVRGPDNTSICNVLAPGGQFRVRVIDRGAAPDASIATQDVTCPANTFSLSVPAPGDYLLRIGIIGVPLTPLPPIFYDTVPFDGASNVARSIRVRGRVLSGRALVNGLPVQGAQADVRMLDSLTDYIGGLYAFPFSDAAGEWIEDGQPMMLQVGRTYLMNCGVLLGASGPQPLPPFVFPSERTRVDCRYGASAAERWTHQAGRLVATSWPGSMSRYAYMDGFGWGVQWREPGQSLSRSISQLFSSGFMVSTGSNITATFDIDWLCPSGCAELPYSGGRPSVATTEAGKRVRWSMPSSASSNGLSLLQTSYDGTNGDYVLFQLGITNGGATDVTAYIGAFMDWDLDAGSGYLGNVGSTALGGRITYVTTSGGKYFGSLFIGAYSMRNTWFRPNGPPSPMTSQQLHDVLSGATSASESGLPRDVHAIHSVGSVRLRAGRPRNVWWAIVAGSSIAEMEANANAAIADFQSRTGLSSN